MARYNPIHQSLIPRKMIAGIERSMFYMIWMIIFGFVFFMKIYFMIVLGIGVHLFMRWLFKADTEIMEVYKTYTRQQRRYDPWPHIVSNIKRPKGFGRDLLC